MTEESIEGSENNNHDNFKTTTTTTATTTTNMITQQALPLRKTGVEREIDELDLDSDSKTGQDQNDTAKIPELVIYDPEKIRKDIVQTFARQSYTNTLAFVDIDFYEKLAKLSKMPETNRDLINRRIGQFVNRRIDKLLAYASSKSDNVLESLSIEERDLYVRLCEAVTDFRNVLEKKFCD